MKKSSYLLVALAAFAAVVALAWFVAIRLERLEPASSFAATPETTEVTDGALPVLAPSMPEFDSIAAWLNSAPLTADAVRGKVVLIDFWTYTCINCIRTLPYVTSWDQKYREKGLIVVGVHTPEFQFEKEEANVKEAILRYGIKYPVALDNDYGTWNAYSNRYWPAHYLFDAQGRLRYVHFGEGEYDKTERAIQSLLQEAGHPADMGTTTSPSDVDFDKIGSSETYVGYGRMESFASPETLKRDAVQRYTIPTQLSRNTFALGGAWRVEKESALLDAAPGEIAYRYSAGSVHLVIAPQSGGAARAEVTLDGAPVPEGFRGPDIIVQGGKTMLRVEQERLYDIIDAKGNYGEHVVRIKFLDAGVRVFAFTFG
jgi:thiol-disulfide isomerase/thioredoxin